MTPILCGPAVTVLTQPGDALYVQKVIDHLKPGDVVVIDAAGYEDVAVIGERLTCYMKRKGVVSWNPVTPPMPRL